MRVSVKSLAALAGAVLLVGSLSADVTTAGGVMTFTVSGTETYSDVLPSDVTMVVKDGAGTLTLTGDSETFHGAVEIREGVVVAAHRNALGRGSGAKGTDSPNAITVSAGAQLRATFDADTSDNTEGRGFRSIVKVAGAGPDGTGAFYYAPATVGVQSHWLVWNLQLTADATVGGQSAWFAKTCDLQGHVLTVASPATTFFYYCTVANPGRIVMANSCGVYGSTLNGTAANVLELAATAEKIHFRGASPINWSVYWPRTAGATIECNLGDTSGKYNVVNGDFTYLGSQLTAWPQANRAVYLNGSLVCANATLLKGGDGVLNLGGASNVVKQVSVTGGELNVCNSQTNLASGLNVTGAATVRYRDAGLVAFTNASCLLYAPLAGEPANLEVSGATDFRLTGAQKCLDLGGLSGSPAARTWGTLTVGEGASLSNSLAVGVSGRGAVYQTGGRVYVDVPNRSFASYLGMSESGNAGYGYWGVTNGIVTVPRYWWMAWRENATAFYVQRGGSTTVQGEFLAMSAGGHGHLVVADGAIFTQTAGSTYLGYTDGGSSISGGDAALTISGEGSTFTPTWFVAMQNRTSCTSFINLNDGGTFAGQIVNSGGSGWTWPEGSLEFVSFDGGVWRFTAGADAFYSTGRATPDKLLCQRGGAVFDVRSGATMKLNASLEAPTGKTVKAITLPTDEAFLAVKFIGPARIELVDSTGVGASAYAPFDDAGRKLRGDVVVTSRGTGYSDATTARVWSMDGDQSWDCAVELEDAASGGVEKRGPGELRFNCANTYAGPTSVKEGTLKACAGALPNGQALEVAAGATLTLSEPITVTTLSGAGTINGDVTVTEAVVVGAADFNAGRGLVVNGTLEFATGVKIRPDDASAFAPKVATHSILSATTRIGRPELDGFGDQWKLKVRSGSLALGVRRGGMMVVW